MTVTQAGDQNRRRPDHEVQPAQSPIALLTVDGAHKELPALYRALSTRHAIDVLTPSGPPLTGLQGMKTTSSIAFAAAHVEDYALLSIADGPVAAHLQENAEALDLLRAFARSGNRSDAVDAGPQTIVDVSLASGADTVTWQEVGPSIKEVSGTEAVDAPTNDGRVVPRVRGELPRHLVRISGRVFEQIA
jgi:putative intracellular protease/amidase